MARRHWPWDVLGIDPTADKAAIRSAYAVRLKAMDVDLDIRGFADLRSARDAALREAAYVGQEDRVDDLLFDAGPDLREDPGPSGKDRATDQPVVSFAPAGWENTFTAESDEELSWDNEFGYGTGAFANPHSRIDAGDDQAWGNGGDAADVQLARLLYPGGAHSEEAFSEEECTQAETCLDTLIADARGGDLGREQAIDGWLAELLAESWPRSAPLLEQAAEAFDWLAQSGEIGERLALQFLNPRLRGMRFVAKVGQSGHPLHKAWTELMRPGKRSFFDRFRIKRDEVETLLGGIRTRYPEVESHLDAERVASWEKPAPSWIVWVIQRVFIFIVVIQALALCGRALDDNDLPPEDVDRIVAEAFGPGRTMAELQAADPKLADIVYATIEAADDPEEPVDGAGQRVAARLRGLAGIAMQDAPRQDVLAILAVRRDLFEAAGGAGTEACSELLKLGGLPSGVTLTEEVRAGERALAWRLAQAGLLSGKWEASETRTMPLPPWVGPGVAERTGVSAERINAVLRGEKTADLCAVRIALIDTLLSRPDDAPIELLRFM
ncbi:hypothetical protein U4960_02860 [Altererythrobacter sp. H2]|uniref:hypothetical protein n=1 Tax=Altererythrobacter sp. H2 TaxID=3108391 RepID=UPI002B4BD925|nr:hypothetical protein [Altererythrobacter sp. H2]WRK96290.1 hypothetical protein U4960_02860 [Altererythrobacter sp. H2]